MPIGGVMSAGRSANTIMGGRAVNGITAAAAPGAFRSDNGGMAGYVDWRWVGWPRTGAMCAPIVQCCCKGPWSLAPGEIQPLIIDWSRWIASLPGYVANCIDTASLWDMTLAVPAPADPAIIKMTSGQESADPDPPDNSDVADLISLVPPSAVQVLISASEQAKIGAQYRLSLCLSARDCDGRRIRMCDCVVITIAEC